MPDAYPIIRLSPAAYRAAEPGLAALLVDAVEGGSSLGFLAPFDLPEAAAFWRGRAAAVADGSLAVWAARGPAGLAGTVSLAPSPKANSRHRAEVVKLIVHRSARGRGLARALLATAERAAAEAGLTLLHLDTEAAGPADRLYRSAGWTRVGVIPAFAVDTVGTPQDCSLFYKRLGPAVGALG